MRVLILAISALLLLLGCLACSGGGSIDPTPTVTDDTAREISNDELGRMALPLEQWPPEYAAFTADEDNGPVTLEQKVKDEDDPEAERPDLEKFGWTAGYTAGYTDPLRGHRTAAVTVVGSEVDLYKTDGGASDDFKASIAKVTAGDFGKIQSNVTLKKVELFEVKVTDESTGFRIEFSVKRDDGSTVDVWQEGVAFRRGRLQGAVHVSFFGLTDTQKAALEARLKDQARKLNDQIASVLASSYTPTGR